MFGKVGIDMIAGPSEVLVIADDTGNAGWIAADLLAQAEHDVNAQSILITDSTRLADEVEQAVQSQLATLPRADIARASWDAFGAIILVKNLDEAVPLANAIAAEHLEIMTARSGGAVGEKSAMPARSSSAPTPPRRSATMSAAPTMCCRPRARRGSPPGSAYLTS